MSLQEEEILNILKNKDKLLESNTEIRRSIYKDLERASAEISLLLSLPGRQLDGQPHHCDGQPHGLEKLLEAQKRKEKEYQRELYIQLEALQYQRDKIQRVWICYQALPVEQYDVLKALYVEQHLWSELEKEPGMNHSLVVKLRQEAVHNIIKLYGSEYTNVQIIELKYYNQSSAKQRKKVKAAIPGQISLEIYGGSGVTGAAAKREPVYAQRNTGNQGSLDKGQDLKTE